MKQDPGKNYLNVKSVAKLLGISERKTWELVHDHDNPIPHFRIGNKIVRIKEDELHAWMQGHRVDDGSQVDRIVDEVLS